MGSIRGCRVVRGIGQAGGVGDSAGMKRVSEGYQQGCKGASGGQQRCRGVRGLAWGCRGRWTGSLTTLGPSPGSAALPLVPLGE